MATIIKDQADLMAHVGQHLGYSEYITVTQEQVQLFADATGDHQWIHLDTERAKSGPFGQTIAHGYLTLSLAPVLIGQIWKVEGVKMGVNYGTNKVRFMAPVPVGAKVRAGIKLLEATEIAGGAGNFVTTRVVILLHPLTSCVACNVHGPAPLNTTDAREPFGP